VAPPGTPPEVADTQARLIAAQIAEVNANSAGLSAARSSAISEAHVAEAQMAKFRETVPILDHEIDNMNQLDERGYAPGLRLLELQRQRRQEAGDHDVAIAQQSRGYSEARKLDQQMVQTREQARRTALADLAKAEAEAILRREEVTKATQKRKFQRILASTEGTIQQLTLHTIGGVVEPARTLMVIVPAEGGLEVEARVLNKDVGFIHIGQPVQVKLEAFPFTRYGAVAGTIKGISRDAVPDQKLGSVYMTTILLKSPSIIVDGNIVPLSPGLAVTADVRTGSRRIISYLLSPLQTSIQQAGRER
jgi:hemolysin D